MGSVKQPVVCPNQHVFCGQCMELWLERNQQCPACRVYITEQNPCKQVLGGLNPETAPTENFSNKELRRARMELIYKDYENELDRIEAELEATKQENKELRMHLRDRQDHHSNKVTKSPISPSSSMTTEQDRSTISLLNTKLKDATELYSTVKAELANCKQENIKLRDQNADYQRETQTLRMDLSGRSPRRFGRYTVATLESKVESAEKQIVKLQKALERSDGYIEEIEKELECYRTQGCQNCVRVEKKGKMRKVEDCDLDFSRTDSNLNDSELPSRISNISEPMSDVISDVKFDDSDVSLRPGRQERSSFDLEIPSPMSKSSKHFTDAEESRTLETEESFNLTKPSTSTIPEPTLDGCKKKLRFTFNDDDSSSNELVKTLKVHQGHGDASPSKGKVWFNMDSVPAKTTPQDMNVSMTPDLEDCFRFMDEAERKLEQRHQPPTIPGAGFPTFTSTSAGLSTKSAYANQNHTLFPRTAPTLPSAAAVSIGNILSSSSVPSSATNTHSFASSLPLTFTGQYPRMHSLSDSLNAGVAGGLPSTGLSNGPQLVQSNSLLQTAAAQDNQSLRLSQSGSNPHQNSRFHSSLGPMSAVPSHSVNALSYSLGGSTLSQPSGLLHPNQGMYQSGVKTTTSRGANFPFSQ